MSPLSTNRTHSGHHFDPSRGLFHPWEFTEGGALLPPSSWTPDWAAWSVRGEVQLRAQESWATVPQETQEREPKLTWALWRSNSGWNFPTQPTEVRRPPCHGNKTTNRMWLLAPKVVCVQRFLQCNYLRWPFHAHRMFPPSCLPRLPGSLQSADSGGSAEQSPDQSPTLERCSVSLECLPGETTNKSLWALRKTTAGLAPPRSAGGRSGGENSCLRISPEAWNVKF